MIKENRTLETVAQEMAQAIINGDVEELSMLLTEFNQLKSKQD